jgi:hypothetical protein
MAVAARERDSRELWEAMKKLQRLGGVVGNWTEKFDRGLEGLYVDLSPWHGTKRDLAYLESLRFHERGHFFLSLKGIDFNDDDIRHLEVLASLEYLDLTDTQVSDQGVEGLREALPKATIIRDAATKEKLIQAPSTSWLGRRPFTADLPMH